MIGKKWVFGKFNPDLVKLITEKHSVPDWVAEVLVRRGYDTIEKVDRFIFNGDEIDENIYDHPSILNVANTLVQWLKFDKPIILW